jgi:hypothetical protein
MDYNSEKKYYQIPESKETPPLEKQFPLGPNFKIRNLLGHGNYG